MNRLRFLLMSVLGSLLLLTPQTANAGWTRTYGGDSLEVGFSLQQTLNGGFIVVGRTESFGAGSSDVWLLKINLTGDTSWTRVYGGEKWDAAYHVEQTLDSGYVIVARTSSFGAGGEEIWLLKTNKNGDTLWTRTYGGEGNERAWYVNQTEDKGYMIFGETTSFGAGETDLWVVKTDSTGDTLWTRTYGAENEDRFRNANKDNWGYTILGYLSGFQDTYDGICLIRIFDDGNIEWVNNSPSYWGWDANYVGMTSDAGHIITGSAYTSSEAPDLWLFKSDFWGDYEWSITYEGGGWDEGRCVQVTDDWQHYIVTGVKGYGGNNEGDLWLLKFDDWGYIIWERTYGGDDADGGNDLQQTEDGGYIVLGHTKSFGAGHYDLWLIKTDANGDTLALIEEPISENSVNWEVVTSVGPQIVLRYADCPDGFHASIFDATGSKVDELHATGASGTISWGEGHSPGVYFIVPVESRLSAQKIVLIK